MSLILDRDESQEGLEEKISSKMSLAKQKIMTLLGL